MPVKVGGSYVSEAAFNFAKSQMEGDKADSGVMKSLSEKFPALKFSIGASPFSGTGTDNVSISPKILKQMENDPQKRMEYEALIYDISQTDLTHGRNLKSAGFIIGDDGGLRAWSISGQDSRTQSAVKRSSKKNWWLELLDRTKEKADKKSGGDKKDAVKVDISDIGKKTLIFSQTGVAKASFTNTDELSKYLFQNFSVVKGGVAKISAKYLRECTQNPDKLKSLFDNLAAADASLKEKQGEIGFQGMRITIDENGEVTSESSKSTITINEEKSRRQIAAAATKGDMKRVLALLMQDLQAVEDGLKKNMCDGAEVEKAKKLLEQAKQKMANLPDRAPIPEEQCRMSVNMLI